MDFPKSIINIDEHRNKIYELLKDEKTVIFIDTNIIALLYQLNKKSREEFFTWVSRCKEKNRFKVPSWVIHEYSSRFTKNQISEYLSSLKTLSEITNKYDNICKFLGMYIDDNIINNNNSKDKYSNVDELKNDIGKVSDILEKLSFLKNHNADFIHEIHTEIIDNFENCQLETDLDSIIKEIESINNIRYEHKIPPGYQDSKKEFNNLGDLILWKEILHYSKNKYIRKVIFLTNDAKKDWVYAPMKIIDNERTKNNPQPNYKIIDNRLVHEFYKYTGSKEIEIIDFEELIKILTNKESDIFSELGRALQTINEPKSNRKSNNEIEQEEDTNEVTTSGDVEENSSTENINSNNNIFDLDTETALKDKYIDLSDDSNFLVKTIIGLKSYNWYKQNAILDNFLSVIRNKKYQFVQNKEEQSRLFVIGRNIYQALCGNSRDAYDLVVNRLHHFIQHTAEYEVNLLIAGMFYEVYFDSEGNFRKDGLKSSYLDELLKIEGEPKLENTRNFIKNCLSEFSLPYVPFSNQGIIDVVLRYGYELLDTQFFDTSQKYNVLLSLEIDGIEFLVEEDEEMISFNYNKKIYIGLDDLKNTLCYIYGIPKEKISIKHEIGKNQDIIDQNIYVGKKKLRKLS